MAHAMINVISARDISKIMKMEIRDQEITFM